MGDGLLAVALPLLAAGLTSDPLAVAAVIAAHQAPWAVVAATHLRWGGTADQRTVLGLGASLRAAAVVLVGLLGLVGAETTIFLALTALVAGLGAALADAAEEEFAGLAEVEPEAGGRSRTELRRRGMVGMAVVGLPLGGLCYEVAAALPFLVDVGVFALAALSALTVRRPFLGSVKGPDRGPGGAAAVIPGLAPGIGGVTLVAVAEAAASSAALGVLVLFALDDLGLGAPAFGFLLAGMALAATLGALVAPTLGGWFGLRGATGMALAVSGIGYAAAGVLADPTRPFLAVAALGVGSGASMVATVVLRALLHTGSGGVVEGRALAGFHARVWAAVPVGALVGGAGALALSVSEVVTAAGAIVALTAVAVALIPAPRAPRSVAGTLEKK